MIHTYKKQAGTIQLPQVDLEVFALTKIRYPSNCSMCSKSIKKGCYCMGKGFNRYCLECSPQVINNAINSINSFIKTLKNLKTNLTDNKTEYLRNNIANSL